jgi:CRP-like cAMP-binding protein
MHSISNESGSGAIRDLRRGGVLFTAGTSTGVWRILSGAVRLDHVDAGGSRFVRLAVAGDCVGEETLAGGSHLSDARAVVHCQAQRLATGEGNDGSALAAGILQRQHQRFLDVVRLRTGTVSDRLRCLLAILAGGSARAIGTFACPVPTLADLAAIIDAAPETVSRVLGDFRREGVLRERRRAGVVVDGARLHAHPQPQDAGQAEVRVPSLAHPRGHRRSPATGVGRVVAGIA